MLTLWDLLDPLLQRISNPPSLAPKRKPVQVKPRVVVEAVPPTAAPAVHVQPALAVRQRPQHGQRAAPATRKKEKAARAAPDADSVQAPMQAKYDAVVQKMLAQYGIRVRKWRKSMSGVAWYVEYRDGRRVNLIESPKPTGPMSVAVFLHEIGHHAIGFNVYKPRCLEEYHAWRWSLEAMEAHGLNITEAVRLRMHRSLWYAVEKAKRRGIKQIPAELEPFLAKPSFARRRKRR